MATNRTSIEIEAKGEFSQLTRGLREVKSALGEVTRVVNTGARSGGLFTDDQAKALDIFSRRFTSNMERMNKLIDDQAERIVELYSRRKTASQTDIQTIDKEIKKHGEYLDALEAEREEIEKIYNLRRRESMEFGRKPARGGSSTTGGDGGGSASPGGAGGGGSSSPGRPGTKTRGGGTKIPESESPVSTALGGGLIGLGRSLKGIGGTLAMLAGVSMTIGQLVKWEQMAEDNIKSWQPLLQRTGMDRGAMTQTGLSRGYNSFETQNMLDIYTQTAGRISQADAARLMDFSRGYGVDASTAAGLAGQMSVRGYGGAGQVLSMAAGVASSSGMEARILEVLETSSGFLQSMDRNLKDNSGNNLLAYTARINQIGMENDATKLTGQSGASLLEQMGANIFNPSNVRWQSMGINMLQRFGGNAVSGMNTFDLMEKWQEGFSDPVNVKVLGDYLARATEGMSEKQAKEYKALVMQEAMGGNTTLREAEQFGELTDWLRAFDPTDPRMASLLKGGNSKDNASGVAAQSGVDQKAAQWQGTLDARIQLANAQWMQAQLEAGEVLIPTKLVIQDFASGLLNDLTKVAQETNFGDLLAENIKKALGENLWDAIGVIAGGIIATKIGGALLKGLGKSFWNTVTGGKNKTGGGTGGGSGADLDKASSPDTDGKSPSTGEGKSSKTPTSSSKTKGKSLLKGGLWGTLLSLPTIIDVAKDPQGFADSLNPSKSGGDAYWNMAGMVPGVSELMSAANAETGAQKQAKEDASRGVVSTIQGTDYYNTPEMQKLLKEQASKTTEQKAYELMYGNNSTVPGISQAEADKVAQYLAQTRDDTAKKQTEAKDATKDAQTESKKSTVNTNKDIKTSIDGMVLNTNKTIAGMKTNADTTIKEMESKTTKTVTDWKTDTLSLFTDLTKALTASQILGTSGKSTNSGGMSEWFKNFNITDPSTWFNFGGSSKSGGSAGTLPKSEVEKKVYAELEKSGKSDWWGTVQKLMSRENSTWNTQAWNPTAINPRTGKLDPNGEHASGLFQFLPSTFQAHTTSPYKDPRSATVEQQTQAFISYVTGKYGDIFSMADRRGLYTDNYKGYADGTYSATDQIAQIHAGEELISRAKTAEVQRKTGLLPSQLLNRAMRTDASSMSPQASSTGSTGGTRRIVVDVNLNGGEALSGVSVAALEQIARQVFEDAAYQSMRQNVVF